LILFANVVPLLVWQVIQANEFAERVGCIEPAKDVVHRRSSTPTKVTGDARLLAAGDDAPDSLASLMAPCLRESLDF
jgi:hypothetical protein